MIVNQKKQNGGKKKASRASSRKSMSDSMRKCSDASYAIALTKPLSYRAIGARVPDMFSAPTTTYHARGTITINSNSSGIASVILTANPLAATVDMTGASVGATGQFMYNSPNVYAAVSQPILASGLSSCRVVGVGFGFKNLLPPTTATGRCIFAAVPQVGDMPGISTLNIPGGVTNNALCERLTGTSPGLTTANTALGVSSTILALPDAEECTIQDIIATQITAFLKPVAPSAFEFHNTNLANAVSSGYTNSTNATYVTGGSVIATADNGDITNYRGFECLMLRLEGLPAAVQPVMEIEYCYHLEGSPIPSSSVGAMVPATPAAPHVDLNLFNNVLSMALNAPTFEIASDIFNGDLASAATRGIKYALGVRNKNSLAKLGMAG